MRYAVEAQGLGKAYRLYARPVDRVVEAVTLGASIRHRTHWALRGVDLALRPGAALGICGANGAGKSTLLQLLSGVTHPSEGRLRVQGRLSSLLELGLGFQLDMSGKANIYTKGLLLGMSRREIDVLVDGIIEFSELGEFIDMPLRTYSAGMGMRLGFSVAAAFEPDVLVLDEIFGVGDEAFQRKCLERINDFKRRNKTILFCSHSMIALRQLCDEAIWIRDGRIHQSGEVVSVTGEYLTCMSRARDAPPQVRDGAPPSSSSDEGAASPAAPHVLEARIRHPETGQPVARIATHDSVEVFVRWRNPQHPSSAVNLGVGLVRQDNILCFAVGTHLDGHLLQGAQGCTVLTLPELPLLSGEYLLLVWMLDETGVHRHQEFLCPEKLTVEASTREIGILCPPHSWSRAEEAPPLP